jgi:hypothetical protein
MATWSLVSQGIKHVIMIWDDEESRCKRENAFVW